MKTPKRRREKPNILATGVARDLLLSLSENARYVGSSAHKVGKNDLVPQQWKTTPRPNASICPNTIKDKVIVTQWLKEAIQLGAISHGAKRVWHIGENGIFEAMSSGNGEYHGYPIEESELPQGVKEIYAKRN